MYIERLELKDFRNYNYLDISFNKGVNVFIGQNAQGKTNILEAICYTSLAKSHRTNRDKEVIRWGESDAYIRTKVYRNMLDKTIEMKFFKQGGRGISINSVKANKLSELIGILNVVIFSPEDLKIVKESPTYRRRFLDIELCKLSKKYLHDLNQYKKVLSERNTIIRQYDMYKDLVDVFDNQLADLGARLMQQRLNYIALLNKYGEKIHYDITQNQEKIEFTYTTKVKSLDTLNSIRENLYELLKNSRRKDMQKGITSVGPHRDDFEIMINDVNAKIYGSQGQQRTSVLTIKFASLFIIKELTGEYPVLLLDDVLSELDSSRQSYILRSLKEVQTFIACTGINEIEKYLKQDAKVFYIENGTVKSSTNIGDSR